MRNVLASLVSGFLLSFGALAQTAPVDLNTADAATLAQVLNGVGPAKAEAIVAHRETHGPFQHIDDLVKVKGIGPATVEQNRAVMVVQPAAEPATQATLPAPSQPASAAVAARPAGPGR